MEVVGRQERGTRMAHRRSARFAPPDFLLRLVALANFMRLSLRERRTRNRVQRSVAGNPGRDDKKEWVVAREGRLLNRGIFQTQFGQVWLDLAQDAVLGLHAPLKSPAGTTEISVETWS